MATKSISYQIVKTIGTISQNDTYSKRICYISWNNRPPVFDIRNWRVDENGNEQPLKGVSLKTEELIQLKELLSHIDVEV